MNYRFDMEQFSVITIDGVRYLRMRRPGKWEENYIIENLS